jgi:hypothetical protein
LLLKVRQGEEEEDQSNPFFQDYTKEDYAAFTNTSLAEPKGDMQEGKAPPEEEEEYLTSSESSDVDDDESTSSSSSKEGEDDDEEGEEETDGSEEANADDDDDDGDYIEDVSESAMFNLVMGTVLRQYQESNGRGPTTEELLCIRQTVAEKMGIVLDSTTDTTLSTNSDSPTDKHKHSNYTEETKLPSFSSKASGNLSCCSPVKKRVKFATEE